MDRNDAYFKFIFDDGKGGTVEVKIPAEQTIFDIAEYLEEFLMGCGFHHDTVKEIFKE